MSASAGSGTRVNAAAERAAGRSWADMARDEAGEIPGVTDVSQKEAAAAFGVNVKTVAAWVEAGMPVRELGRAGTPYSIDLIAATAWRAEREAADVAARAARDANRDQFVLDMLGGDAEIQNVDGGRLSPAAMKAYADSERALMVLARDRGELVRVAEVEVAVSRAFGVLAARVGSLPGEIGRRLSLSPADVERIDREIGDALNEAARAIAREFGVEVGADGAIVEKAA